MCVAAAGRDRVEVSVRYRLGLLWRHEPSAHGLSIGCAAGGQDRGSYGRSCGTTVRDQNYSEAGYDDTLVVLLHTTRGYDVALRNTNSADSPGLG